MSFGFSVGDFITVGKVIAEIISLLQDATQARQEYQELIRELESLNNVLRSLDKLQPKGSTSSQVLDSIKYSALSCRQPMEEFLQKIKKYDSSLGTWSNVSGMRGASEKLKWAFGKKEGLVKLQNYLNVHVGTISLLMAEYGIEVLEVAVDRFDEHHVAVQERLDGARKIMTEIEGNVAAQTVAVQTTQSMVMRLCNVLIGEASTSWRSLFSMIANIA